MRAVAKEAGIEAGSIYYHFSSKDELIGAVLDFGMTALSLAVQEALAALPTGSDHRLQIKTAIHAHVSAILKYGDYTLTMRRVFGQVPKAIWRRHVRLRENYGDFWHSLLCSAQKAGMINTHLDLTVVRLFLLGGLNWVVEWYDPRGQPLDKLTETFGTLLLNGMTHKVSNSKLT